MDYFSGHSIETKMMSLLELSINTEHIYSHHPKFKSSKPEVGTFHMKNGLLYICMYSISKDNIYW